MLILKKSKSLNTKMEQKWLDSAGINHFWMIWRFEFLISQLKKNKINITKNLKIMDLGCGNGILSNQLEKKFKIKIDRIDGNEETLKLNKNVNGKLICYNIKDKKQNFKNKYDIIFIFDVIEHVKNDLGFLENALFHLKSNGIIIINVPSIKVLFSKYDHAVGHLRRYDISNFNILENRLKIKKISISYWGFILLPILLLRKLILLFHRQKNFEKIVNSGWKTNKYLNTFFKFLMKIELNVFNKPFYGTSLMVFYKKNK
jgi:2-polyprenyl-3-methyl-5-hydroxy-6-metoxy-1,4-benzoquinol methylase